MKMLTRALFKQSSRLQDTSQAIDGYAEKNLFLMPHFLLKLSVEKETKNNHKFN